MNIQLFSTVSNKDYIGYTTDKGVKSIVNFLGLRIPEVSKAVGLSKQSIRYDERMPYELHERLAEIGNIINLTASFFYGDLNKTSLWFKTKNPLLGDISPREMICYGRYDNLRKFILNAIAENKG